jgi:hypothetical protein
MGRKSCLKRERRLNPPSERLGPDGLNDEEGIVLNALEREFEVTHGRKPVVGDLLFVDDDGNAMALGPRTASPR